MFKDIPNDKLSHIGIIFLENKVVGDYFYDNFYKHGVEYIIVTGDGSYPKDIEVKAYMWDRIKNDPNVNIIIFSKKSMQYLVNAPTSNITILHDLLENDITKDKCFNDYTENYKFNFNEISFSYIIHRLFLKTNSVYDKKVNLLGNKNIDMFDYNKETNSSKVKWQAVLIDSSINPNESYTCREIPWDSIKRMWEVELWKGREDIKETSAMSLTINQGYIDQTELEFVMSYENCSEAEAIAKMDIKTYYGYTHDMRIFKNYIPTFFGVYDKNKLVGVNSGHRTKDKEYRSRGLWVDPDYRGKKIGKILLQSTINKSIEEGCDLVWTLPRQSSMPTYNSVGFEKQSDWINEGMMYGPNCIAIFNI